MAKLGFTVPKLHDRGGNINKEWYVSFCMSNPSTGERKPFPHRRGLNYLCTKAERYAYAKGLVQLLHDALKAGWNPFEQCYEDYSITIQEKLKAPEEIPEPVIYYTEDGCLDLDKLDITKIDFSLLKFNEALDFCLASKKPNLEPSSYKDYGVVKKYAQASAINIKLDTVRVKDLKRSHIKLLLDQIGKDRNKTYAQEYRNQVAHGNPAKVRKFSGNNYNKYKQFLHILFTELEEYDAIEYNPCSKISDKPEIKTNRHRHANAYEEQAIKQHLKEHHLNLYIFLAVEELSGARPKEILSLRISDIDWCSQHFSIKTEGAKTREARKVAIPNTLIPLINLLQLGNYNPSYYIFSSEKDLTPGPEVMHRDKVTKMWNRIVKRELGIDVSLYSFKGLGGEKKRDAGIDKTTVSKQFGHTNTQTTDIYLHRESERQRRSIIENTPDF